MAFDLGKALATELGVPFQPIVFPANGPLLAAAVAGQVDVIFTNQTAERAKTLDFSETFMDVEKSFLVPAGSPVRSLSAFEHSGLRVGVSSGSSTAQELGPLFPGSP